MTTLHDSLTLPCGQVLPNRLMKSAMSEVLGDKHHAPTAELERLYARGATAATDCWSPAT